jgi:hypothetical protein
MRPSHDLMKRLAAADPLPGAEQLSSEEQHEADELLARVLAAPASLERHTLRRPRMRRWALAAVATAGVALAAFAAGNLLDEDAPGPNVVELAVAAVSAGDAVYHTVERTHLRGTGSLPDTRTIFHESWRTADGRQHQKWFRSSGGRRGKLMSETAGRRARGRRGGPMLIWDSHQNTITSSRFGTSRSSRGVPYLDPDGDPGPGLRALEAQGRLRLAASGEVDGRRAYRLVSDEVKGVVAGSSEQIEYLVDAETYLPLASNYLATYRGDTFELHTRYLVYERLPLNAKTHGLLELDPHPGATCALGAGETMGRGTLGFPNPCAH